MVDISKLITDFLFTADTVIIPGFGKISKEYIPARLDHSINKISPPHFLYNFDDSIQEDRSDALLCYISKIEGLSFEESAELLQNYKKELLLKINESGSSNIHGIGSFYTESDFIKFTPTHFDLSTELIDAIPVVRKINQVEKVDKSKLKKGKVMIYRIMTAVVICVSLLFSMIYITNIQSSENASVFAEKNPLPSKTDSLENVVSAEASAKSDSLGIEIENSKAEIDLKSFHIAVGTYSNVENATKIEKLLKSEGYEVLTKQYKSGKVKVTVLIKGQVSDLNKALKYIRTKYDKAAFVIEY